MSFTVFPKPTHHFFSNKSTGTSIDNPASMQYLLVPVFLRAIIFCFTLKENLSEPVAPQPSSVGWWPSYSLWDYFRGCWSHRVALVSLGRTKISSGADCWASLTPAVFHLPSCCLSPGGIQSNTNKGGPEDWCEPHVCLLDHSIYYRGSGRFWRPSISTGVPGLRPRSVSTFIRV